MSCGGQVADQAISRSGFADFDLQEAISNVGEDDWHQFNRLTSTSLSPAEVELVLTPGRKAPEAREFLAVHWHPEWAPLEFIRGRLASSFPQAENSLVIPTQHNRLLALDSWAGVEADVYDRRYGLKVQLLIHLKAERLGRATALQAMMDKTYDYRANQLMDILNYLVEVDPGQVAGAEKRLICSVSASGLNLARFYAARLRALIEQSGISGDCRAEMLKNRLLTDFISTRNQRSEDQSVVRQALVYIDVVKKQVKAGLNQASFYAPEEVIEEARSLGAGVVIPHPPAFWPILLSDLDVDGWEVWNPSTPHHTLFLLNTLERANQSRRRNRRPLLVFMGDDTHMSGKIRPMLSAKKDSASREIGFQDPWLDPVVKTELVRLGQSLTGTLNEYRERLA